MGGGGYGRKERTLAEGGIGKIQSTIVLPMRLDRVQWEEEKVNGHVASHDPQVGIAQQSQFADDPHPSSTELQTVPLRARVGFLSFHVAGRQCSTP